MVTCSHSCTLICNILSQSTVSFPSSYDTPVQKSMQNNNRKYLGILKSLQHCHSISLHEEVMGTLPLQRKTVVFSIASGTISPVPPCPHTAKKKKHDS